MAPTEKIRWKKEKQHTNLCYKISISYNNCSLRNTVFDGKVFQWQIKFSFHVLVSFLKQERTAVYVDHMGLDQNKV